MEEWFFSDFSARVAMVNQVDGGLGVGIKYGRWERRGHVGAGWAGGVTACEVLFL
jgi:hypothetical protein